MRSFKLLCFALLGNLYFIEMFRVCLHIACTSTPVYTRVDLLVRVKDRDRCDFELELRPCCACVQWEW